MLTSTYLEIYFCYFTCDHSIGPQNGRTTLPLVLSHHDSDRLFPSSLLPLFQSESESKTILMKMTLICMKIKLPAGLIFALRLVLKQRHKRTRKWRIVSHSMQVKYPWEGTPVYKKKNSFIFNLTTNGRLR